MVWVVVEYEGGGIAIHEDADNRVCFMATDGGSRKQAEKIAKNADLIVRAVNNHDALVDLLTKAADELAFREGQEYETVLEIRAALDTAAPRGPGGAHDAS